MSQLLRGHKRCMHNKYMEELQKYLNRFHVNRAFAEKKGNTLLKAFMYDAFLKVFLMHCNASREYHSYNKS